MFKNHHAGINTPNLYTRNPNDYIWACRGCHMLLDNRKNNLKRGYSWLGRKHSEETKLRLARINTGKKRSLATRQKMSLAQKGRIMTGEHKQRLREASINRWRRERNE